MKMQSAVEEYLVEIEVRKYTPKTIRSYRCNLNLFLRFCAEKLHVETVAALTPAVVRQFSRCMSEAGRKGTYINGVLKSIKSFIQYCYEEGYGGFDTRKTFKWCKEEKPVITAFSPEQVRIMLQSCRGHDYLSLRDYAILTLLFETGIRCWELCCIREEDIHDDFIIINGKNHKQRVVPITPVLKKAMLRYESGKEIHKCPECFMPVIIGLDGKIIPQSQLLPYEDVRFLPANVEKLYNECRKCFLNECYHSVIMVSRTLLMYIAVDKGADAGKTFAEYINYLETNGFIGSQNKAWVDKIRKIGNKYTHEMGMATQEDADKVIVFIKQLLGNLYEMPHLAEEEEA